MAAVTAVYTGAILLIQYTSNECKPVNLGPSEKRTTSVQRTAHLSPIDFTIELIPFEPPKSGLL